MSAVMEKTRLTLNRMGIATPWWPAAGGAQEQAPVPASAPVARSVRSLSESITATPAPAIAPAPDTVPDVTPDAVKVETVAPFSVLVNLSHSGWLAVSVMDGQHERMPAAQSGLVQDLLQAITAAPIELVAQEVMSWPPKGSQRRATAEEARDMLHGCVQRWCGQQPVKDILLLGDQVIEWSGVDMAGKPLASQFIETLGQRCLALPGWPGRLDANAKRALWRLIAALRDVA